MIANLSCPICASDQRQVIGVRTYCLADYDRLSPYIQKRYRVLFEIWAPGVDEVTLTSQLCQSCGFVRYEPRPTADEVDAKYRFLSTFEPGEKPNQVASVEKGRAQHLYRHLARHLPDGRKARILDFGGGDGGLMREFVARGHRGHLVDYCKTPIPGVERVAATHTEIPAEVRYDIIVASHVIEHVAEPLSVVNALRQHLEIDGCLFVEVPMEIWGKAPLHEEPVTHVNFFTPASLRRLLELAGLHVVNCQLAGVLDSVGNVQLAVRATGRLTESLTVAAMGGGGATETLRFLKPDALLKLKRHLLMPEAIPAAIAYKIQQFRQRYVRKTRTSE